MSNLIQTAKGWKLDESKLTDEQKQLIEIVRFPREVSPGKVLQKRIMRRGTGTGYVDRENHDLSHFKYLTTSYNIAHLDVVKNHLPKDMLGRDLEGQALVAAKKLLEKQQVSRSIRHEYFDATKVQAELESLFERHCTPVASKSMIVNTPKEVQQIEEAKPKGLSPTHKGKVKAMYKEQSMDATEIAKELSLDIERVITYVKTL